MDRIYIAAPVVGITDQQRYQIDCVAIKAQLMLSGERDASWYEDCVYQPWKLKIPNAWNMPMNEWARCVFTQDVTELDRADVVIVCDYGRKATAGTAWEAGYAFAREKKIIVVQMPEATETSLMVRNGCTVYVKYDDFLDGKWDWPDYKSASNDVVQN